MEEQRDSVESPVERQDEPSLETQDIAETPQDIAERPQDIPERLLPSPEPQTTDSDQSARKTDPDIIVNQTEDPAATDTQAMSQAEVSEEPKPETQTTEKPPTPPMEHVPQPSSPIPQQTVPPPPVTMPAVPTPPGFMSEESEAASDALGRVSPNALNMLWSFGLNRHVPVINLSDCQREMIAYTCAHTGILYDFKHNKQTLLQGHSNVISCTCVSADKRWLATADKGFDSMVIVWDTFSGIPVRTIFDPNPEGGVVAMAMTPDAKYIATLNTERSQIMAIWNWTVEGETPVCTAQLHPDYGLQNFILFNPEDTSQIVSNGDHQAIFYSWENDQLEYFAPPLTDEDFNKPVGKYSQSIFQRNSIRALTATSLGNLVVWDTNKPLTKVVTDQATPDKKALKLVKLQEKGINVITTTDQFIITADVLGHVKFFDQTMKLINWYQDFNLGPVTSLSFAHKPELSADHSHQGNYPPDATIRARPFVVRDFVIGSSTAIYGHVQTDGTDVKIIHKDHDASVFALASHPTMSRIAVGSYSGLLKLWDYSNRQVLASRNFGRGLMIRCCVFDPKGVFLAVGFTNGVVHVMDALTLENVQEPCRYARDAITHVAFSHDSQYLATADAEFTMTVFKRNSDPDKGPFCHLGRHRAHYKLIQDIMFGVKLDSDAPRLLSLGEDRYLVEYDLTGSSQDNLVILASDRIEQSAVPMCMAWYPALTKENFIISASDQFKFKLYNVTTKMCRKTTLGPTFGSPLQKVIVLPETDSSKGQRHIAYITTDKVGLHILPVDGNPHKSMALVAHPQGCTNLACSHDGRYLFTAGGQDGTVHMWDINLMALDAQAKLGGEDLIPFYGLLDGGREGELFKELEDYFYYAQARSQGVNTMNTRKINTKIPLSEVPFVMRALGLYPSEQEVEDMLNEVKYSTYVETSEFTEEIDLGDFIKLYINHRPAFGLQPEKMQWAFNVLGIQSDTGPVIPRGELLELLQDKGEHMTEYELAEYLTTLLGFNEEGGSSELQEFDPDTAGDVIEASLPDELSADMFADELLGFGMYNDVLNLKPGEDYNEQNQPSQISSREQSLLSNA